MIPNQISQLYIPIWPQIKLVNFLDKYKIKLVNFLDIFDPIWI
jgi:hypothetical protein